MNEVATILPFSVNAKLGLAVLMLPLLSFIITISLPKGGRKNAVVGIILLSASFIISITLFFNIWNNASDHARWIWFELGSIQFTIGIWLNNLTVLLLALVIFVSLLVHLFSVAYMADDKGFKRYFAFLGLFTFSMLGIVLSDNLLIIFIFWELVGLSSYLLIGFWFHKDAASQAAKKAFIINRIGDLGFLVGLMLLWTNYNTLDLTILIEVVNISDPALSITALCLFCGVIGKSAQFPLLVWLPDAMEGPTPVSALIHAATMVAAGVFLLARINPLVPVEALHIIALIGAVTAFMGGIAAIRQFDIKKILAYSTISQLGYMVVGMGAGAYDAAIFHLVTHAFFKACLFLSAGAIIHTLHQFSHDNAVEFDAQDIRNMGGLRKKTPFIFWVFLLSSLALMGVPLFSGFLSKDAILIAAATMPKGWQSLIPLFAFSSVVITAYYVMRMLLVVFEGENRLSKVTVIENIEFKNIPILMKVPLAILALGSLFIVFAINPLNGSNSWILKGLGNEQSLHNSMIPIISVLLLVVGAIWAFNRFKPSSHNIEHILDMPNYTYWWHSMSFNNWHLNTIYDLLIVQKVMNISHGIKAFEERILDQFINNIAIIGVVISKVTGLFDRYIVDGFVHLTAFFSQLIGWFSKGTQGGKAQTHIVWAGLGILILIFWLVI